MLASLKIPCPCRNPRRCSSLAWHPSMPTQIAGAYEDDSHPVMQLWDLRSPTTYVHEYQAHHKVGADKHIITFLGSGGLKTLVHVSCMM